VSWYSARLLFESVHDPPDPKRRPLFEESIVVFQAGAQESIPAKLRQLEHAREIEYRAAAGNLVRWEFREVLEVQEISTDRNVLEDGIEVYFRWWEKPGPQAFRIMRKTHSEPWWLEEAPQPTDTRQ